MEWLSLIQFLAIAYLAGATWPILLSSNSMTSDLDKNDYYYFFYKWIIVNFIVGGLYIIAVRFISLHREKSDSKVSAVRCQLQITIQYLILFLLAGVLTFWSFIASTSGQDVNIGQAWQGFKPLLLRWLLCAMILSGIRLIIMYLIISYSKNSNLISDN
jgi:hypothetical protein